jgi:ABC-type nitrate/sulfonate/bicarbonate transport system substrate-binding protein
MMRVKHFVGAGIWSLFLLLSGSCNAAVTIQTGLIGAANSAEWEYYIGIKKGFFADAGVTLDVIYVPTASGLVQQLAAGSLDIVDIGIVEPIHAVARGAAVAILRITGGVSAYEVLAKPEIKTIKDLKGRTVVIGGLVDINRVYLERILKAGGLTGKDVDITVVGNTAGRYAALKSGAADATMLAPPVNFFAEMKTTNRDDVTKSYDYLRKIDSFPSDNTISKKRLEALMDEMTAIGDTQGRVPLDKLLLAGVAHIGD